MHRAGKILLYALAFGVVGYAAFVYGMLPLGAVVEPDVRTAFLAHPAGIYTHIAAAAVALALGPFQFSGRLRNNHRSVHRWIGRAYLGIGVLVGGMAALYISQFAFGGLVARLGFASLAVCWLFTGLSAYIAIRRSAIAQHRKWMMRNFSLSDIASLPSGLGCWRRRFRCRLSDRRLVMLGPEPAVRRVVFQYGEGKRNPTRSYRVKLPVSSRRVGR